MIVNSIGRAALFSQLQAGDWYSYGVHGVCTLAFCIKMGDGRPVGFVFSGAPEIPRVAFGGHPYSVLRLPNVEIRPDLGSLHFNNLKVGELISSGDNFYMTGSLMGGGDTCTANLVTGSQEVYSADKGLVSFSRWSAGVIIDGKWVSIFEFPIAKA